MAYSVEAVIRLRDHHRDHLPLHDGQTGRTAHEMFIHLDVMFERWRVQRMDLEHVVDAFADAPFAVRCSNRKINNYNNLQALALTDSDC